MEFLPKLKAKKRLYAKVAFFKRKLMQDIDSSLVRLNMDAELLAEYKGADETWNREVSGAIRGKNTVHRRKLKEVIQLLADCHEKHLGQNVKSN
jgi:hypothetical protein